MTMWPELPYAALKPTLETLQLWTQIVGKIRLSRTPWINHSWHVTLYVSARGLTTGLIPHDDQAFELEFDFPARVLEVRVSDGGRGRIALEPRSVADFHDDVMRTLTRLGVPVGIDAIPNELPNPTPFPHDTAAREYDGDAAEQYWRALIRCERVFTLFRTRFIGKCSPVHMFWGALDLAVTRFSGRGAPRHPGGIPHLSDAVTREAYSHEVSSAGFWPGGGTVEHACFYSYSYPSPAGFSAATVSPPDAYFDPQLGEFLLPYDAVRTAGDPEATLLGFLQTTYEAAANAAHWDRAALDVDQGVTGRPRAIG